MTTSPAGPAQPGEPRCDPLDAGADRRPPPDVHGLGYDTDLLALALADTDAPAFTTPPPDPALEAEFAAFAAMARHHHTTDPADDPEEYR